MAEPANTPVASSTPQRPVVLHIGDAVEYNPSTYAEFSAAFDVIRPTADERARPAFMAALRERRWGDFAAIFRPHWGSGGEMGKWDRELVDVLPPSVRVFASAGAGFDWADTELLGERGTRPSWLDIIHYTNVAQASSTATRASQPPRPSPTLPSS